MLSQQQIDSTGARSRVPKIAVVVPVFNRRALTARFLESFASVKYPQYEIVVVDDGSSDGTAEWLAREHPQVTILPGSGNLWWTAATNLGVRYAIKNDFDFVLTINNDALVHPDFLTHLVTSATSGEHAGASLIGCCLHDMAHPDQVWTEGVRMDWRSGQIFDMHPRPRSITCNRAAEHEPQGGSPAAPSALNPENNNAEPLPSERFVPADTLTGCGVLIPVACFTKIGLYNERSYPHYHADSEFGLRAGKMGFPSFVDRQAVAWYDFEHTWSPSSGKSILFSRSSPYFWKPVLNLHLSYCPWRSILPSLLRHYVRLTRLAPVFASWLDRKPVARST